MATHRQHGGKERGIIKLRLVGHLVRIARTAWNLLTAGTLHQDALDSQILARLGAADCAHARSPASPFLGPLRIMTPIEKDSSTRGRLRVPIQNAQWAIQSFLSDRSYT